jgi:hypothetical protein
MTAFVEVYTTTALASPTYPRRPPLFAAPPQPHVVGARNLPDESRKRLKMQPFCVRKAHYAKPRKSYQAILPVISLDRVLVRGGIGTDYLDIPC